MSNTNYWVPKSAFVGVDANGNKIKFYEWDFNAYATKEVTKFLAFSIFFLAIGSLGPPLMLLFALFNLNFIRLPYIISAILSGYVSYDYLNQWFLYLASKIIFGDKIMEYILMANIITFVVSILLLMFIGIIREYILKPLGDLSEEEFNSLTPKTKKRISQNVFDNVYRIWWLLIVFIGIGMIVSVGVIEQNKDWLTLRETHIK
jgi:hypothetical protein